MRCPSRSSCLYENRLMRGEIAGRQAVAPSDLARVSAGLGRHREALLTPARRLELEELLDPSVTTRTWPGSARARHGIEVLAHEDLQDHARVASAVGSRLFHSVSSSARTPTSRRSLEAVGVARPVEQRRAPRRRTSGRDGTIRCRPGGGARAAPWSCRLGHALVRGLAMSRRASLPWPRGRALRHEDAHAGPPARSRPDAVRRRSSRASCRGARRHVFQRLAERSTIVSPCHSRGTRPTRASRRRSPRSGRQAHGATARDSGGVRPARARG